MKALIGPHEEKINDKIGRFQQELVAGRQCAVGCEVTALSEQQARELGCHIARKHTEVLLSEALSEAFCASYPVPSTREIATQIEANVRQRIKRERSPRHRAR